MFCFIVTFEVIQIIAIISLANRLLRHMRENEFVRYPRVNINCNDFVKRE